MIATAVAAVALVVTSGATRAAIVGSLIFGVIGLSYVVVTGFTGQISLAQLTLAGVAGFLLGPLSTTWRVPLLDVAVPFPIAPIVAALGATVIGVVIGLPAVRVRGLQLAVVTLAFAVAIEAIWFRNSSFVSSSGFDVDGPTLAGWDLSVGVGVVYPRIEFCLLVLAVLVAVAVGVARLRTSRLGSAMLAVRANERSAAAAGVNVAATKLAAFACGSFIAGLGGSLLAYQQGNVTFDAFSVFLGLGLFATAYMAGITSVSGGLLAGVISASGIVFFLLDEHLELGAWFTTISGLGLILTVIANPEGIAGRIHLLLARLRSDADATGDAPDHADVAAAPLEPAPLEPAPLESAQGRVGCGGRACPRGRPRVGPLPGCGRGVRRVVRGATRRDRRPDRAERRRQDHAARCDQRLHRVDRPDRGRRSRPGFERSAPSQPCRGRTDLPVARPVRRPVGRRERDGGDRGDRRDRQRRSHGPGPRPARARRPRRASGGRAVPGHPSAGLDRQSPRG